MASHRLLMAEDHLMVGQALRRVLEPEFAVDGPHPDGRMIAEMVRNTRPHILLLDLWLKHKNGLEIIPEVVQTAPGTRIVVMTMNADPWTMDHAIALGATGFVPKNASTEDLLEALRMALRGEVYRSPAVTRSPMPLSTAPLDVAVSNLTPRRREAFEMIADGLGIEEIARRFGCSRSAVYYLRDQIKVSLGFETDEALNRLATLWRVRQASMGKGGT